MKKRGRPSTGVSQVLFVRVTPAMRASLDARLEGEREAHPHRSISIADIAREAIAKGLER